MTYRSKHFFPRLQIQGPLCYTLYTQKRTISAIHIRYNKSRWAPQEAAVGGGSMICSQKKRRSIPLLSGSRRHDTSKPKQKSRHSLCGDLCSGRAAHLQSQAIVTSVVQREQLPVLPASIEIARKTNAAYVFYASSLCFIVSSS
jgi:hypothetical protein